MTTFAVNTSFGPGLTTFLHQLEGERAAAVARHPETVKFLMGGLAHVVGYLHSIERLGSAEAIPDRWRTMSLRRDRRRCEPAVWPDAKETSVILANQKLRDAARSVQGVAGFLRHDAWDDLTDPAKWQFVDDSNIRWIGAKPIAEEIAVTEAWVRSKLGDLLPAFMGFGRATE